MTEMDPARLARMREAVAEYAESLDGGWEAAIVELATELLNAHDHWRAEAMRLQDCRGSEGIMSTDASILAEIAEERRRQDEKWGPPKDTPSFDPDLINRAPHRMAEHYEVPSETRAKWLCDENLRRGTCTMAHILVEEVAEVVGSFPNGEAATREELIQVAAVCVKWIHIIDARNPEMLPRARRQLAALTDEVDDG